MVCWHCERVMDGAAGKPSSEPGVPLQFSIETLLLLTTLVAVCLGVAVAVPPLGLPISVVALGGLVRTLIIGKHHGRLGVPFPLGEKVAEFIISCGVVIGAIGVGAITLLGTCCLGGTIAGSLEQVARGSSPGGITEALSVLLAMAFMLLALCAPLFTTGWFLWATRPR
jgi:hypothetical protein